MPIWISYLIGGFWLLAVWSVGGYLWRLDFTTYIWSKHKFEDVCYLLCINALVFVGCWVTGAAFFHLLGLG